MTELTTDFIKDIEPFFYRRRIVYVDVGAHRGAVYQDFARSGLGIREAHLVEPNPRTFAVLEKAVETVSGVRLVTCHAMALGAEPGRLRLRAADSMTKVLGAAEPAPEAEVADPEANADGEVLERAARADVFEIEASTLDALSAGFERRHIGILKLDVEGYEPQVLAGARGLLADQAIDVVYVEAGIDPANSQQSYYREIEDLLGQYRYRLFRIYEQAHEWLDDSPLLRRVNLAFMSEEFAARNPYRLSRELFEIQREKAGLVEKGREAEALITRLRARIGHFETARAETAQTMETIEAARAELRVRLAAADLARGQAQAEIEAAAGRAAASETARAAEVERLRRELSEARSHGKALERRHLAVLESASWRATEPVRRLIRLATGRPEPKPFAPAKVKTKGQAKEATRAEPRRIEPTGDGAKGGPAPAKARKGNRYIDKLSNKLQSGVSMASGGEFIPFEILKPATRLPAAPEGARFVFAITLASSQTVPDWNHTERLLGQTLRSVLGQTDPDWTAVIAGHEMPDIPEMADDRIEFVAIHRRPPSDKSQFRGDKSAKRHVLGRRLAQMGGGYFMQLDADDLVRDDLVATLRGGDHVNGAVATRGYALDYRNRLLAPVPGAWRHDLNHVCGSCSVVRYTRADLPGRKQRNNEASLVFNMTRQHAYTSVAMEELGRPLEIFAEPMVVYLINHGQSLSFSMQKSGNRGQNIVEAVARHALPAAEAEVILRRFGLPGWIEAEAAAADLDAGKEKTSGAA
ncbi:FkbM family methyltransferase [uncultured Amaricoccus sp.]|uniref:FkbM family methyltransferase n=2 Tax=Amaricoccus TaxID=56999 RepID=UPI00262C03EA|nr:FkbM family methyltransferase [uncultured Amaricoccus sp.]